jgi:DNA replication protein DnaC
VRFFAADDLTEALYRGLADNTVGKLIQVLLRHDLVVIDDLGFTSMDRLAAEHLFRFVSAAYLRMRAHGPPGLVAGAASYSGGLAAQKKLPG